jgi:UDP-N-acetyl-D-glucosamine dehydrogenase
MGLDQVLREKIHKRTLRIAILGLGYVGLPLTVTFAEAGFHVTGIDIDQQKVEKAARGESYITAISNKALYELIEAKLLHFTSLFEFLYDADAICICVPTPLLKARGPDISSIISTAQQVQAHLHPGQLVVLESTTYPGTTDEVVLPELEASGLKVGIDFFLAFSPERIDPGNPQFHMRNTPKVVGGVTPTCTDLALALYEAVIEQVVPVSSARVAEMSKLLENTFRAVNIGLVNEMAIMCEKLHIDVWEVIDAAATKPFGFMRFLPGPGPGGHCIPIDPLYLSWKLRTLDYTSRFIELAAEINTSMPYYVVDMISQALHEQKCSFDGATVLVLGVAYKRNINDIRESPALDIIAELQERKADVIYNDEYVPKLTLRDHNLLSQPLSNGLLQAVDCIVIVTDHDYYDVAWIVNEARCIVDTRNMTRGYEDTKIFRL